VTGNNREWRKLYNEKVSSVHQANVQQILLGEKNTTVFEDKPTAYEG
jgi:hypothetical protein